jgi:hypothetical protein
LLAYYDFAKKTAHSRYKKTSAIRRKRKAAHSRNMKTLPIHRAS